MRRLSWGAAIAAAAALLALPGVAQANCGNLVDSLLGKNCSPGPASPDPGGSESPDQPVPPSDKRFGFNSSLMLAGLESTERELGWAHGAGATTHRMPVPWRYMQPESSAPPLPDAAPGNVVERIDGFYADALARGIKPVFTTYWAPAWATRYRNCGLLDLSCHAVARSDAKLVPDSPFLDEYEVFVRAVKQRWPEALIESWNEPNRHWSHSHYTGAWAYAASPAQFAEIQCAAYRGSKAVNDDPVLAAGWAWHRFSDYVKAVYAAGADDCWDIANLHIYSEAHTDLGANSWFAKRLHLARELRRAYGDTDPIWVTEIGWTTSGPTSHRVSEADQADAARRAYNRLVTMDDIQAVIFHTLRDAPRPGLEPSHEGYGYGFVRENGAPKPVYCEFATSAGNQPAGC